MNNTRVSVGFKRLKESTNADFDKYKCCLPNIYEINVFLFKFDCFFNINTIITIVYLEMHPLRFALAAQNLTTNPKIRHVATFDPVQKYSIKSYTKLKII